jgi:hypothetical protein
MERLTMQDIRRSRKYVYWLKVHRDELNPRIIYLNINRRVNKVKLEKDVTYMIRLKDLDGEISFADFPAKIKLHPRVEAAC